MKSFIILILLITSSFNVRSQNIDKGKVSISIYCGLPNTLRWDLSLNQNIPNNNSTQYRGLSPFGLRAMVSLSDDISLGVDIIYGISTVRFTTVETYFFNDQWVTINNENRITTQRLRPQIRLNKHLETRNNLEQYMGFAIGGNRRWTNEYINDTLVLDGNNNIVIPISLRMCYGFNYPINHNMKIGGELGLGGPLIQMSLTYKL